MMGPSHLDPTFVHQAVMPAAQRDQIRQLGLPTLRPMLDMMRIEESFVGASGKPTSPLIARAQRPTNRRRNAPGASPHAERSTLVVLDDPHDARVAADALDRLEG